MLATARSSKVRALQLSKNIDVLIASKKLTIQKRGGNGHEMIPLNTSHDDHPQKAPPCNSSTHLIGFLQSVIRASSLLAAPHRPSHTRGSCCCPSFPPACYQVGKAPFLIALVGSILYLLPICFRSAPHQAQTQIVLSRRYRRSRQLASACDGEGTRSRRQYQPARVHQGRHLDLHQVRHCCWS